MLYLAKYSVEIKVYWIKVLGIHRIPVTS